MSDAAAAGNGQAQGDGGEAQQGPDLAGITSQLEALTGGHEELRQLLQSAPWAQAETQAAEEADPGLDLSFLQEYQDPAADPQNLAEQLQPAIEQLVQQRLQAAIGPVQQQVEQQRIQSEAEALVGEFPEMGDPEKAQQVVALARELAEELGQPQLANEPKFWRQAYMVGRAVDQTNNEGRNVPNAAHLEGGGGATPAGSQVDPGDLIVQAGRGGSSVLPFK